MEVKSKTADIAIIDAVTAAGSIGEGTDYDDLMIVDVISSADSEVYAVGIRKSNKLNITQVLPTFCGGACAVLKNGLIYIEVR